MWCKLRRHLRGLVERSKVVGPLRVYLLILVLGAMLPGTLLTGVLVWRAFANDRAASERRLLESARNYGVSLPDSAVSSEGLYD